MIPALAVAAVFVEAERFNRYVVGTVFGSRATAKLMGAALEAVSDAEIGLVGVSAAVVPDWVVQAERIRTDIGSVKDKMNKLKE